MIRTPLRWTPSPYARSLLTVAVLALTLAVALGRADALVLAAPLLWAAASRSRGSLPSDARIEVRLTPAVCFEGESSTLRVRVGQARACRLELLLPAGLSVERRTATVVGTSACWTVRAERWGRWTAGPLYLRLRTMDRLWQADAAVATATLTVYPRPSPPFPDRASADRAPLRIGQHTTRLPGTGAEFTGVRAWTPGEPQRRVNWPATRRTGRLQVTAFADERAVDLVLCLDAYSAVGPPGSTTLDLALRGAAGLARAYLRNHDRVGIVTFGGALRWLGPDLGDRQFYRIAQMLIDVRRDDSFLDPNLDRIPRTALPPLARAVVFSPLLDPRAVLVLHDLRGRGHQVVLVDPLTTEPVARSRHEKLTLRWWRLHRYGQHDALNRLGVPVVAWDGTTALDPPFAPHGAPRW